MARTRRLAGLWVALVAFGCLVLVWCINWGNRLRGDLIITSCCGICLLIVWRGIIPQIEFLQKREDHAVQGAEAEEEVGAILDRLPRENHIVLHGINTGFGDIDHIIVRRDGAVFAIETKSHRGTVGERNGRLLVWGRHPARNYVGQAGRNAIWLSKKLTEILGATPWVNAAIVFPNAYVSARSKIGQVDVVSLRFLERWMLKFPAQREIARRLAEQWEKLEAQLLESLECPSRLTLPAPLTKLTRHESHRQRADYNSSRPAQKARTVASSRG